MRRAAFSAALAVALGSSHAAWAQCTKDTDCKGDRICSDGTCTDAAPAPVSAPPVASTPTPSVALSPPQAAPAPAVVMSPEAAPTPRFKRRSTGMYVTGIVLTSTGGLTLLGAGIVGMLDAVCVDHAKSRITAQSAADEMQSCDALNTAFWSSLIPGVVLTAAGIPLWAVGGEQVRAEVSVLPQVGPRYAGAALRLQL